MRTPTPWWPLWALVFNALVWGLSWWPLRELEGLGWHPLWSTLAVHVLATGVLVLARPGALWHVLRTPQLWWIALAAGVTNAAFNWGVVVGDVVRVVLLFYLMPLWSVLLARWLLKEPFTPQAWVRVVLALAGALIVMGPQAEGEWAWVPLPRSLADALAVLGGMSFALNNVLLRREAAQPQASRALAMFVGGVLVAGVLAGALAATGKLVLPPLSLAGGTVGWGLAAMALVFLASNLALQYGAARLPAAVTSVVMLTEVLFATVSAVWLGSGKLTQTVWVGGAFILAAAALSAFERPRAGPSH